MKHNRIEAENIRDTIESGHACRGQIEFDYGINKLINCYCWGKIDQKEFENELEKIFGMYDELLGGSKK